MSKIPNINKISVQELKENSLVTFAEARLIPSPVKSTGGSKKKGNEPALTSVFLSGLRLVDEFHKDILKLLDMKDKGTLHFLTEVEFKQTKEEEKENTESSRFDGLILSETRTKKNGKNPKTIQIVDATIFEMKSCSDKIDPIQIQKYINKAKELKIKRIVTISNEFTSSPKTPTILKHELAGKIKLYHLAWTDILTIADLRIHKHLDEKNKSDDKKNISDSDQQYIMEEIYLFMDHPNSGVDRFKIMKGWNKTLFASISRKEIEKDNPELNELIHSWKQEEQDLCQLLTREMKQNVKLSKKYTSKKDENDFDLDIKQVLEKMILNTKLKIHSSLPEIEIEVDLKK